MMLTRKMRGLMVRLNLRTMFILMCLGFTIVTFCWFRCADSSPSHQRVKMNMDIAGAGVGAQLGAGPELEEGGMHFLNRAAKNYNMAVQEMGMEGGSNMHDIECVINKENSIQCRREDNEVYLPFSFIQKYFEVYGSIVNTDGYDRFEFSHSYSMVHPPGKSYKPDGVFMSFEHYNVEERKRVRCVTATEGIPQSTQWNPSGHFYPIQIAQFGLSHYSKFIREGEPDTIPLMDGGKSDIEDWVISKSSSIKSLYDDEKASKVLEFSTSESLLAPGVATEVQESTNFALTMDIKFTSNGSIGVKVKSDELTFHIFYVFTNNLIMCEGKNIYYGLGTSRRGQWFHMARDIDKDFLKGLLLKCSKYRKFKKLMIVSIHLRGSGLVDNMTLASAAHMDHFHNAANWLVNHQDSRGGWPIMVTRKLIPDVMELPPGWYSAMAQGQAMSTLVRAYLISRNSSYLKAAIDGMKVFDISSSQGGVKARFADRYDWYEEYPTTPSSYVLNGFIYSLLGLYDLKEVTEGEAYESVKKLYDTGMESLKAMLLMFDSGMGTFYDLRHVSIGIAPNRARWDYHTTHINQLLQLSLIDDDPLFSRTANRWMDYMKGKRSSHN